MKDFLEKHSGKIIGVGDIFDYSRSPILGETEQEYIIRTAPYWKHFEFFVTGNHDFSFLEKNFKLDSSRIFHEENVLAIHGHQLTCNFNQELIEKYEGKFDREPRFSLFWEIEERLLAWGNKFFRRSEKSAKRRALSILKKLDGRKLLWDTTNTVIVGHDHLAFDVKVEFKGKVYRVANCGSGCKGFEFNPVYVEEIDRWFVSDLHLGTRKAVCE